MPTYTRRDLGVRALGLLGVTAAGQSPAAEDVQTIDGLIDPALAMLAADRVVYVGDADQIADELFLPVAICVADAAKTDFGITPEGDWPMKVADAKATLRRIASGRPTYATLTTQYF
jgi:hypothetical protein